MEPTNQVTLRAGFQRRRHILRPHPLKFIHDMPQNCIRFLNGHLVCVIDQDRHFPHGVMFSHALWFFNLEFIIDFLVINDHAAAPTIVAHREIVEGVVGHREEVLVAGAAVCLFRGGSEEGGGGLWEDRGGGVCV